jgi:hypothetical protein
MALALVQQIRRFRPQRRQICFKFPKNRLWYSSCVMEAAQLKRISRLMCLLVAMLAAVSLCAESKNPADYPLRLHIFTNDGITFYHNRYPEESRGDGRANLFENGEPQGLDFSFDCSQKIKPSFGFETYPTKWKKQNEQLIVLFPVIGKSNQYFTCTLNTQLKDYAYVTVNGRLSSESPAQYKAWMASHNYDPEHGKNNPVFMEAAAAPSQLDEAQRYLTGAHKDTEKAKALLLAVVGGRNGSVTPETMVWANIYLGYIEDRANNRQNAIDWYRKALAVEGAPPGSASVAKFGLQRPLVWIRHLDDVAQRPAK